MCVDQNPPSSSTLAHRKPGRFYLFWFLNAQWVKTKLLCKIDFASQRRTLPPLHNTMKTRAGNRECCYKLQSLMGDSVIIRCIYKPGTTFPARLLSITSHRIIVPCHICQLTLALLIKWTTRGRWTERKQLVIFPVIISLFGLCTCLSLFVPSTEVSPGIASVGRNTANRVERKDKICWKPHLELSASHADPITAFRGREGGGNATRNNKKQYFIPLPYPYLLILLPSFLCLLRKWQHYQNPQASSAPSPLSWPFHSSKGYLMSLEK